MSEPHPEGGSGGGGGGGGSGGSGGNKPTTSLTSFVATRNWKFAFNRVVRNGNGSKAVIHRALLRQEWSRFTEEQVGLLLHVAEAEEEDLPEEAVDVVGRGDFKFVKECFMVAMEQKERRKFEELFVLVDKAVEEKTVAEGDRLWEKMFPAMFQKAVEMENVTALRGLLALAHDSDPPRLPNRPNCNRPAPNDSSLLAACKRDHYEMVKLFASYGYRIKLSFMTLDTRNARLARGESNWRDYAELPFLNEEQRQRGREDQIYNLFLLKMMSVPSYIFACYMVAAERRDIEDEERTIICECEDGRLKRKKDSSKRVGRMCLNDVMAVATGDDIFHHCPASEKFSPHPDCVYHMECNDPIYRCFDLARIASEGSKSLPEFRTEFSEIAQNCRKLAAKMLDKCDSSEQVTVLLEEKTASVKYFKQHTYLIRFPRARLAIEHSHKEFVSHMHCQQFLRNEWIGNTNWLGKMLPFKLLYFILQIILSPIYVLHALVVLVGRDIKILNDGVIPEVSAAKTKFQRAFFKFLHYCDEVTLNLDAPLNRFLTTMGYYAVYIGFIIIAAIKPLSTTFDGKNDIAEFAWYHACILIYASNQLYRYFLTFIILRGISHFFTVWRIAFLITYSCVFCGLVILLIMSTGIPCTYWTKNVFICPDDLTEQRQRLSDVSACLFGAGAVGSVLLMAYLMQLHDRLGPVIITYSRVTIDFITMTVLYAIMILAFSFGFAYILSSNEFISETTANKTMNVQEELKNLSIAPFFNHDDDGGYRVAYTELVSNLFWSILNPGPPEYSPNNNFKFSFVTFWFAFFQIMSVIVFLNLLIATMNSTVQRVDSQKEIFWKFTRTSVWIEYYDVTAVLPPPFTMLNIFWILFYAVFTGVKKSRRKLRETQRDSPSEQLPLSTSCNGDRLAFRKRLAHARLVVDIIQSLLKNSEKSGSKKREELDREELIRLKKEIVEEILLGLKNESKA